MNALMTYGLFCCSLLQGCAVEEPSIVSMPTTARAQNKPLAYVNRGAIFQPGYFRPLVEDSKPTVVGDTLTVTIRESTATSATEQVSESRSSAMSQTINAGMQLPLIPPSIENALGGTSFTEAGSASQTGKGSNQVATSFVSSITVTVIDILANGNLLVSGEKQVRINSDIEAIRLSGVVNPRDIGPNRTITSLQIADARVEQLNRGNNRLYNEPGWLTKILLSVLPF